MRQPDHEYEERSFGDIQRAIDFENSIMTLNRNCITSIFPRKKLPSRC